MTRPPRAASSWSDGHPHADRDLPPPAEPSTPTPDIPTDDEGARQTADTIASISRVEEFNQQLPAPSRHLQDT